MDIWGFLQAIYHDWVNLVSGFFSIILTYLGFSKIRLFQIFKNPDVQRKVFLIGALLFFVLASIRVWTQEHNNVITDRKRIYREFVEEKQQRIYRYQECLSVIDSLALAQYHVNNYQGDQESSAYQRRFDNAMYWLKMINKCEADNRAEQIKFLGILTTVEQTFVLSPKIQQLIKTVKPLPYIERKLIYNMNIDNPNKWLNDRIKERKKQVYEFGQPLNELDEYLRQQLH